MIPKKGVSAVVQSILKFPLYKIRLHLFAHPFISLFIFATHPSFLYHLPCSVFELASVKAALHRLESGVWTSVRFGDMRRALSACVRLILLQTDPKELRDYGVLLYHC